MPVFLFLVYSFVKNIMRNYSNVKIIRKASGR